MQSGKVYWITGLSGAGKTTIGRLLYQRLCLEKSNIVFLDGDILREVFGNDLGHSKEDRFRSAMRNARLCKMLSDQGLDVVCATISLFHQCQEWNRANIFGYVEIFLDVPVRILEKRDSKGLYRTEEDNLVGIHIVPEPPQSPDITILNDGSETPEQIVQRLLKQVCP